ncbi:RHS repeat-associated core domain-containing protein [uncultured Pseudomonas sp.]|uniref:RHS repeat-associated core domain-containing protein n=1 Tax=uncultured Pseudomonas sp. TaxID=114707 RepID=UPI0034191513
MTSSLVNDQARHQRLRDLETDQRQEHAYLPHGFRPSTGIGSPLPAFNGEYRDPLTGHYLLGNGYRAFNPLLMRFNSPDSLSPFAHGGVNSYAYCRGDPVNATDITGHFPVSRRLGNLLRLRRQVARETRLVRLTTHGFDDLFSSRTFREPAAPGRSNTPPPSLRSHSTTAQSSTADLPDLSHENYLGTTPVSMATAWKRTAQWIEALPVEPGTASPPVSTPSPSSHRHSSDASVSSLISARQLARSAPTSSGSGMFKLLPDEQAGVIRRQ